MTREDVERIPTDKPEAFPTPYTRVLPLCTPGAIDISTCNTNSPLANQISVPFHTCSYTPGTLISLKIRTARQCYFTGMRIHQQSHGYPVVIVHVGRVPMQLAKNERWVILEISLCHFQEASVAALERSRHILPPISCQTEFGS